MKNNTATISEVIKSLEGIKQEVGDVLVFVVHLPSGRGEEGVQVTFDGISGKAHVLRIASTGLTGAMLMLSDEYLVP